MALVRWDPVGELSSPNSEFNRLLGTFFGARPGDGGQQWAPAMDLLERDDHYLVRADLPGMSEEDLEIEIKDRVLTIAGERKAEHEASDEGFYRLERAFGRFQRSLALPEGVDAESVTADFDRGVLELRVPKPAARKPHRITIGSNGSSGRTLEGTASEK